MSNDSPAHQTPTGQRTTRWGSESQVSRLNGMSAAITAPMTSEQIEAYVLVFRIEEINQSLRAGNIQGFVTRHRSPSPPPVYDTSGRRINTRERRYRQNLEDERQRLVDIAIKTIDGYEPPHDLQSSRCSRSIKEKVFIPVTEFPALNFIGQILGPRGQSLRKMSAESGANIVIRGKGSVKEGSSRSHRTTDDMQEPLHCLVTADSQQKVEKAKELINTVIEDVIFTPEDGNGRKRDQLRQLAQLNGTFRDDEHQMCQNCGQHGHRQYTCPEPKAFSANVTCSNCHNAGHLARDCPDRKQTGRVPPWRKERRLAQIAPEVTESDREYEQLMLELSN